MKCPKCGYTSFPYLESCPKCGRALAEPRAALGLYALHPDPPDLLRAYQVTSTDIAGTTVRPPVSAPSLDLGLQEKIELDLTETEPTAPDTDEGREPVGPAPESTLTLDREVLAESPPLEAGAEPLSSEEMVIPQSLDLSGLAEIPLELENAEDLGDRPAERSQTPTDSSEGQPVYDLDLDEDLDDLTVQPLQDESHTGDADDEEVVEYTLEIEDELEFEIDELEVEQDDAEEEDDDDR